jgi:release factor glutamine methyltransferase
MTNSKELFSEVVKHISLPEPKAEIESIVYLLFEKKWRLTRTDILAEKQTTITWMDVDPYIHRINTHEPIQYILGQADFYGRPFLVNPSVLIPRQETELLVQEIINHTKSRKAPLTILDIGTGSGCIAISLALELNCNVTALDVSLPSLTVARENAARLKASVNFSKTDILKEQLPEKYDIIVSNPPYISLAEKQSMKRNVLDYEPHTALFPVGVDTLIFYRVIAKQAQTALKSGGSLWFEINEHYAKEICEIMKASGFESVTVLKDWSGKDRVVWGF